MSASPLQRCVQQIVNALRQYETETGRVVESVKTDRLKSTTCAGEVRTYVSTVRLELHPTPEAWA